MNRQSRSSARPCLITVAPAARGFERERVRAGAEDVDRRGHHRASWVTRIAPRAVGRVWDRRRRRSRRWPGRTSPSCTDHGGTRRENRPPGDRAVEVVRRPVARHLAVPGGLIEVDVHRVLADGLRARRLREGVVGRLGTLAFAERPRRPGRSATTVPPRPGRTRRASRSAGSRRCPHASRARTDASE